MEGAGEAFTRRVLAVAGAACLAVAGAAGCSGMKVYRDVHDKNAVIQVKTDTGSFVSRRRTELDLYSVNRACQANYLGTVKLDMPVVELGLPVDETVLLLFIFSRSSFGGAGFIGSDATATIEIMTTARKGHRYEFEVSYSQSGYGATGLEFPPGSSKGREIDHQRLRDCVNSA